MLRDTSMVNCDLIITSSGLPGQCCDTEFKTVVTDIDII